MLIELLGTCLSYGGMIFDAFFAIIAAAGLLFVSCAVVVSAALIVGSRRQ